MKNRALIILEYLWENTDEDHTATTTELLAQLSSQGVHSSRKTIADDVEALQDFGVDVICNRKQQNEYFIGSRILEPVETKILMDAVQAAKFLSDQKSKELIEKLSLFTSVHQRSTIMRGLRSGTAKTRNNRVYYIVDDLLSAVLKKQTLSFQYVDRTSDGDHTLKHDGRVYTISPYDLVWNEDGYYIFGWSETHGKVVKFRVERICNQTISDAPFHLPPSGYDISAYCRAVFSMYDGELCTVELKCENSTMTPVLDRLGDDAKIEKAGPTHFKATAEVFISATFFAWIISFGGKIELLAPEKAKKTFAELLERFLSSKTDR